MPDWRRIIVGDAFTLPSRDLNYYRDLALVWPLLIFSIVAISSLLQPESAAHRVYGLKAGVAAIVVILLAKERLILVLVAACYVALRCGIALVFVHDLKILIWFLLSGGIVVSIALSGALANYKPTYQWPQKMYLAAVIAIVVGLGGALALCSWMKP